MPWVRKEGTSDGGVGEVGEHRGGVVAPHGQVLDGGDGLVSLLSELPESPIVIQSGHRTEVLPGEALGMGRHDQSVGVGWVTNNQHLDVLASVLSQSLALFDEDLGVLHEQVSAFLALGSGLGTHEQGCIDILEA